MAGAACSIIIPNYNGRRFLPRLMASLAGQSRRDFEIVIVDDGSRDGGPQYLAAEWPAARILQNPRNLGFAGTVNAGIRTTHTPFVVLLNNDTHVDPRWMEHALAAFDPSDVGSVASLSLHAAPPHVIDTAGDVYTVAGGAAKRLNGLPREAAESMPRDVFSASGVSAFFRRTALEQAGLMDRRFESYYEDVDLGFRLQWAGWRCVFEPRSVVYHHVSSSYAPTGWRYRFNSSRNAEVVWWSHLSPGLRRRYLGAHLFCLALQGLAEARRGCLRPWACGKLAALRLRRRIAAKRRHDAAIAGIDDAAMLTRMEQDWYAIHVGPKVRRALQWLGAKRQPAKRTEPP